MTEILSRSFPHIYLVLARFPHLSLMTPTDEGILQAKQPQHAKKPSIVPELGADLDRPSTDDLAREVYNYTGETGTYRYMAPEVFRHEPYNAKVRSRELSS